MSDKKHTGITKQFLDWIYTKALNGFGGADSAYILAESYLKGKGTIDQKVNSLIKWQTAKSATSGFLSGFGGFVTIPFTIPANVASVIYIQIRMIAAIAYMGGHDIRDDKVKTLTYICMAGNSAKELLKEVSIRAGEKALTHAIQKASVQTVSAINQKAGQKALSKLGVKGIANAGKIIPVVGGLISGSYDAISTKAVGMAAKKIFIDNNFKNIEDPEADILPEK
ncbi:uncharacterized protein (DUF697 family) [Dysgonomonas sp. PH5-45]|uniref:EcsC family protein n=1 Tax=unclassified Dysgonomonas TaxID=2630389 RepID=UPI0024735692|nr:MULTISPECIES: EcsC family protein [unclassified Dysgonomonas]MDH6353982.1 uncharacterized protein (DUF697 family) [Dysgonomonas sp. PH5-45]MDH6386884.1 uncharacterized protein (DUF697 family) [Dysgonomonas sp. PH5-37]